MQITDENIRELKEVVRRDTPRLLKINGVQNIAIGLKTRNGLFNQTLCIQIFVKRKRLQSQLTPENAIRITGYPVDVIDLENPFDHPSHTNPVASQLQSHDMSAPETGWVNKEKFETLCGGIHIQREGKEDQGTLGLIVYDIDDGGWGMPYLLSCAQLIAKKATSLDYSDAFLCQGGNTEEYRIGEVVRSVYEEIHLPGSKNEESKVLMDAAVAQITDESREIEDGISGIPDLERIMMEPKLGMEVLKSGAQSGATKGIIFSMEGNVFSFRSAIGNNQSDNILVCQGDFGSIVVGTAKNGKKRPVGLVISQYTFNDNGVFYHYGTAIRIVTVFEKLRIKLNKTNRLIYKFYNPSKKYYHYDSMKNPICDSLGSDYSYQEPAFQGADPSFKSSIPVYGYSSLSGTKDVFYTVGETFSELKDIYTHYLGALTYTNKNYYQGGEKLLRLYNPSLHNHIIDLSTRLNLESNDDYEIDYFNKTLPTVTGGKIVRNKKKNPHPYVLRYVNKDGLIEFPWSKDVKILTFYKDVIYTIKPGDTLQKISKTIYGDQNLWPSIYTKEKNWEIIGDNPDVIPVYKKIVIAMPVTKLNEELSELQKSLKIIGGFYYQVAKDLDDRTDSLKVLQGAIESLLEISMPVMAEMAKAISACLLISAEFGVRYPSSRKLIVFLLIDLRKKVSGILEDLKAKKSKGQMIRLSKRIQKTGTVLTIFFTIEQIKKQHDLLWAINLMLHNCSENIYSLWGSAIGHLFPKMDEQERFKLLVTLINTKKLDSKKILEKGGLTATNLTDIQVKSLKELEVSIKRINVYMRTYKSLINGPFNKISNALANNLIEIMAPYFTDLYEFIGGRINKVFGSKVGKILGRTSEWVAQLLINTKATDWLFSFLDRLFNDEYYVTKKTSYDNLLKRIIKAGTNRTPLYLTTDTFVALKNFEEMVDEIFELVEETLQGVKE